MIKRQKILTVAVTVVLLSAMLSLEAMAAKGSWRQDDKGWKVQLDDDTGVKDTWALIDGFYYHFNKDGYRETGWLKEHGKWYYLGGDGRMYADVSANIDGIGYTFDSSGVWTGNALPGVYPGVWQGATLVNTWADYKFTLPEGARLKEFEKSREAAVLTNGPSEASAEPYNLTEFWMDLADGSRVANLYYGGKDAAAISAEEYTKVLIPLWTNLGYVVEDTKPVTVGGHTYNRIRMLNPKNLIRLDVYVRKVDNSFMMLRTAYMDGDDSGVTAFINSITPVGSDENPDQTAR